MSTSPNGWAPTTPPSFAPAVLARSAAASTPAEALVVPRLGAAVNPAVLHLTNDAAVKQNAFTSHSGYAHSMANMQTSLHVEAWVENRAYAKHVWADVHVFDHAGALVHHETLPLRYARPAGDGGDVFVLDAPLFQGMVATPGSVDVRPDARLVQYRLYAELEGRVFTDGLLHDCALRSDSAGH